MHGEMAQPKVKKSMRDFRTAQVSKLWLSSCRADDAQVEGAGVLMETQGWCLLLLHGRGSMLF